VSRWRIEENPADPEKCIRQCALIAATNAKFHSNPILAGQCTVGNAGRKEEKKEGFRVQIN
jgi:hypothetical protein